MASNDGKTENFRCISDDFFNVNTKNAKFFMRMLKVMQGVPEKHVINFFYLRIMANVSNKIPSVMGWSICLSVSMKTVKNEPIITICINLEFS